jgi:hypothetical protein
MPQLSHDFLGRTARLGGQRRPDVAPCALMTFMPERYVRA